MTTERSLVRLKRLLELIPWLKVNQGVTIREAATTFGVTPEQLIADLRDIYTAEVPGLPTENLLEMIYWRHDYGVDEDCSIFLTQAQNFDRVTQVDPNQAAHLAVALDALGSLLGEASPAVQSALAKVKKFLPHDVPLPTVHVADRVDEPAESYLPIILEAIDNHECVVIAYLADGRDQVTARTIEPFGVKISADRTWVGAWCKSADDFRTFRLDRIIGCAASADVPSTRPTTQTFPDIDSLTPSFGTAVRARSAAEAMWVFDGLPGCELSFEADGSVLAQFQTGSAEWLVRWGLRYAEQVKIESPVEVRNEISERAQTLLNALQG